MPNRNQGFTLIELLITLTLFGIVLAIAVPGFTRALESTHQRTLVNQLLADLNFARSRAITTRQMVSLCAGDARCDDLARWREQIIIFDDTNANGVLDGDESPVRISSLAARHEWNWGNFRNQRYMSFKPDGTTHSLNGTFTLCRENQALETIVINITGRTRLGSPTDNKHCT
ncbi:GspH/FimT family pseudopilin [Stutzerimonas stutzeri]|uniref:GspH/FimT family pseudopilin n=1 Tax=Stutzerimonas stutzeri TaxID=316 RepID=UPI0021086CA2|nr:GspH/FimT family protein [Stutzerimonas stutzeri]MCQ4322062.1 GspH/FimT family protein [Stutzerimonas stutzeri]